MGKMCRLTEEEENGYKRQIIMHDVTSGEEKPQNSMSGTFDARWSACHE